MPDNKPLSPFTLTPPRILILVLGVLALIFIVGGIMGGVANYEILKGSTSSSEPEASSSDSPG